MGKAAVGPKLAGEGGRGFVKQVFSELAGALERAADKEGHHGQHEGDATDSGQATTA
jgi:hypothetical protein